MHNAIRPEPLYETVALKDAHEACERQGLYAIVHAVNSG